MAPGECVVVVLAGRDSAAIPAHTGGEIYGIRGVYPKVKKGESVPVHSVVHQHRGCPYNAVAVDSRRPVARVLGSCTHTEFDGEILPPLAAVVKAARNLGEPGFTGVRRQRHPGEYGRQTMKLEGILAPDLSAFLPGLHMTMRLADHGADVIMVEPANGVGEPTRVIGYRDAEDVSVWFRNISRGKRSLTINLKDEGGRRLFHALVKTADVLVEAFRSGVAGRLGIDYGTLSGLNPRLVYCSISAFGQDRPLRDKPAAPNVPAADTISSLQAGTAILMALPGRERTGRGDCIDLSMYDALLACTPKVTGPVFGDDAHPEPKTMRSFGGAAMYHIYETADGEFLVLGGSEAKFARNLLTAFDRLDLMRHAEIEPGPEQEPLRAFFRERFAEHPRAYWEAFLKPVDCCWAFVRSLKDAFEDPHTLHRRMLLTDARGNRHIGPPIKYADEPARPHPESPVYGERFLEIWRSLGIDEETLVGAGRPPTRETRHRWGQRPVSNRPKRRSLERLTPPWTASAPRSPGRLERLFLCGDHP